jgi:capsular exopolysaccharide family
MDNKNIENQEEINIQGMIEPFLRKWQWFVLSVVMVLFLTFIFLKIKSPIYKISSTILIKEAKSSGGGKDDLAMGLLGELSVFGGMGSNSVENELEILKSKKLMRDVVLKNNLQTSVYVLKSLGKKEVYKDKSPIVVRIINENLEEKYPEKPIQLNIKGDAVELVSKELSNSLKTQFGREIKLSAVTFVIDKNKNFRPEKDLDYNHLEISLASIDSRVSKLQEEYSVNLADKKATVIALNINVENIEKGKDILNELVKSYNADAIEDKDITTKKTLEFIDERIKLISEELGQVENKKQDFKQKNKLSDIDTEVKLGLETNADARKKQLEVETQMNINKALLNSVVHLNGNSLLPINTGVESAEINSGIDAYNRLVLEKNRLLENATDQHPAVAELNKQIQELKKNIINTLNKNKQSLEIANSEYATELAKIDGKISKVPYLEKIFRNIERTQQIKENLYLLLLQKREESAISLNISAPKARVVDVAYASEKPIAPKKIIYYIGALMLGLLVPFLIIYLRRLLNDKIITKQDLERLVKDNILVELPSIPKNGSELVGINDLSSMAEAFRILITNLKFKLPNRENGRVVLVTSTVKGEGKTFVSINTALTLAGGKSRVVIIGADIRNPQLQRYERESRRLKGLTEYLHGDLDVQEIIHQFPNNANMDIIYSGMIPPNPTDLLTNGRFGTLIEELRQDYQYIIIDSAPLLLVPDTLLIADTADATIYVSRSKHTKNDLIEFANKNIREHKIHNVGFILNDVNKHFFSYGHKYSYGYHKEKERKSWWNKILKFK